jgi:hypothetical protein
MGSEKEAIEQAVRERITVITTRPFMYAKCREAYAAQLAQLLELGGWRGGKLYDLFERDGAAYVGLEKDLDDEWAQKFGNAARTLAGLPLLR